MTIQDEKLKKLAMAIKAAKRRKDQVAVDRLVSEREVYKKSQEKVEVSVKRPKLNDSCVQSKVSVGNSTKESVRQSVKVNVSDIVTESVEITTRLDGSKTEKKEVTHNKTFGEEIALTNIRKVASFKQVAVENYRTVRVSEYGLDYDQLNRQRYVEKFLLDTESPYDPSKTLLDSLKTFSVSELMKLEEGFLKDRIRKKSLKYLLETLPKTSAIYTVLSKMTEDVDIFFPYQVYQQEAFTQEIEDKIKEALPSNMAQTEHLREVFTNALVGQALQEPNWTKKNNLKFIEKKHKWDKKRMEHSIYMYELVEQDLLSNTMFEDNVGLSWELLQSQLLKHFITMKVLIGSSCEMLKMNCLSTELQSWRDVKHGSYFEEDVDYMDYKFHQTGLYMSTLQVVVNRSIVKFSIEIPLLKLGWENAFESTIQLDQDTYKKHPDWTLVTPENLIRRAKFQSSSSDTKKMDHVLKYAKNHSELLQDLMEPTKEKFIPNVPYTRENLLKGLIQF
jgi:hypothetical protein